MQGTRGLVAGPKCKGIRLSHASERAQDLLDERGNDERQEGGMGVVLLEAPGHVLYRGLPQFLCGCRCT